VLPQPRLKKNYSGRAFRLLALTLHNALEERLASATPQEHSTAHFALGQRLLSEKRYAEAERELREVVSLTPADPQAHLLLAQALEAESRHHEASAELEASLKLKNSVEAHLTLAHVYLSLNQPALARLQGQAALDLDPGNHEAQQLVEQGHAGAATSRKTP
jgi:Tfp pilus assembly protein PilF